MMSEVLLNKFWYYWLTNINDFETRWVDPYRYTVARNGGIGSRFESWLYQHGITVVQQDRVRYAKVLDADSCMMLLLSVDMQT